ncbi:hypothetical protein SSX86_021005 [Deinandra increscens subsp. villosa]|uniref:Peptidase C14 caspase domain-containing protein n=1 Tax=Deinandra increscens subsp. villosa TaxID=3103831 RepID=A0AAP0GSQ6_9ASTR
METRRRCKGCKSYLTVPSGQPCSVCNRVNTSKKKGVGSQILNYIDGYANRLSPNNPYVAAYGQQPAYTGYSAPPVYGPGYYSPQQQQPSVYNDGYYSPQQQQPSVYNNGYYSPQQPSGYTDGYNSPPPPPLPQAVSPVGAYGSGSVYNNQHYQPVHERKRAVLCGVTYKGHKKTLTASVNNVKNMCSLLLKLGFPNASIHILTEDESDPARIPTRRNIETAIAVACQSSSGKILDDEVNAMLVKPLPHGATLHCIMDTCFSGTLLDLPFLCRIDQRGFYKWETQTPSQYGVTSGGKAICISACDDHQNSADTQAFTGNTIGALTYSFIQAVKNAHELTYGDLLDNMRKKISEAQQGQGINAQFASSSSQEPQLSCSKRFEIYSELFIL